MSEVQTLRERYYRGELPMQKGVDVHQRIVKVRALLERLLAGNAELKLGEIAVSNWKAFSDGSGRPISVTVIRDGHLHVEELLYSDLFDGDESRIIPELLTVEDRG